MQESKQWQQVMTQRPCPRGMDVVCQLQHFAIISYAIAPERLRRLIPSQYELDTVDIDGVAMAMVSVVPFDDCDFRYVTVPFWRFRMGQTNYRIYIRDRVSGERGVWFLGTVLDSWSRWVPRRIWKLPWHRGRIRFDCQLDPGGEYYHRYRMETRSEWADASVEIEQDGSEVGMLEGFPDVESGLIYLTHPLVGYYERSDGRLGSYRVWHDRLRVKSGRLRQARFRLLEELGLVSEAEQQNPHSVMVSPRIEFTIYLPPQVVG